MSHHVNFQISSATKWFSTHRTTVWLFSTMGKYMLCQLTWPWKLFGTFGAWIIVGHFRWWLGDDWLLKLHKQDKHRQPFPFLSAGEFENWLNSIIGNQIKRQQPGSILPLIFFGFISWTHFDQKSQNFPTGLILAENCGGSLVKSCGFMELD